MKLSVHLFLLYPLLLNSNVWGDTVFVDIDANTYNIDPVELEKAINPKTKAIMGVNLFGRLADWEAINSISSNYGIPTIEDAAQSHLLHEIIVFLVILLISLVSHFMRPKI